MPSYVFPYPVPFFKESYDRFRAPHPGQKNRERERERERERKRDGAAPQLTEIADGARNF